MICAGLWNLFHYFMSVPHSTALFHWKYNTHTWYLNRGRLSYKSKIKRILSCLQKKKSATVLFITQFSKTIRKNVLVYCKQR